MNTEESIITQRQLAHEKLTRFSLLMVKLKFDESAMREKINRFDADELTSMIELLDNVFIQFTCNDYSIELPQKN